MNAVVLDSRLMAIAEMVGSCLSYADIGCDHGRLGAYLLLNGQVQRAQLTDISEKSLKKARLLMKRLQLEGQTDFRVGDGASALTEIPEVTVIAGMGGALIANILKEGRPHLGESRLLLQPNVAVYELRQVLVNLEYTISDERVVQDGRRNYVIIEAIPGRAEYTRRELIVGPVLLKNMPKSLEPYAAFRLRVADKALRGAMRGGDAGRVEALNSEVEIWSALLQEVRSCPQQ